MKAFEKALRIKILDFCKGSDVDLNGIKAFIYSWKDSDYVRQEVVDNCILRDSVISENVNLINCLIHSLRYRENKKYESSYKKPFRRFDAKTCYKLFKTYSGLENLELLIQVKSWMTHKTIWLKLEKDGIDCKNNRLNSPSLSFKEVMTKISLNPEIKFYFYYPANLNIVYLFSKEINVKADENYISLGFMNYSTFFEINGRLRLNREERSSRNSDFHKFYVVPNNKEYDDIEEYKAKLINYRKSILSEKLSKIS